MHAPVYKKLLQHSGVYAIGTVLNRCTSLLLLPVYTQFLTPADYGAIAILDITVNVLGILIMTGLTEALTRHHFTATTNQTRDAVWWTGLTITITTGLTIVTTAFLLRVPLAHITLGVPPEDGALYYSLILPTLLFNTLSTLFEVHMRVEKRSMLFVTLSFARLLINASLNISLLAGFHLGITGLLSGNLITSILTTIAFGLPFVRCRRHYSFCRTTASSLLRFGAPFIVITLLAFAMHNADRYILAVYSTMTDIGIYSLGYQVGEGMNTLLLLPFGAIWSVLKYEIADESQSRHTFATIFQHFTSFFIIAMLATSLFAHPILSLLVDPSYLPAADIVPWICLGYVFFASSTFFTLSATLHSQTTKLIMPSVLAAATNIGLNMALVPHLGIQGAAFSTVATFAVRAASARWICNKIEFIRLPILRQLYVLLAAIIILVTQRHLLSTLPTPTVGHTFGTVGLTLLAFATLPLPWLSNGQQHRTPERHLTPGASTTE